MQHFYENIHGFCNYQNVYDLMIKLAPDNAKFVEIGVWKGKSVSYAAVEIINSNKNIILYAVDSFEGSVGEEVLLNDPAVLNNTLYDQFLNNIYPVRNVIKPIPRDSLTASYLFGEKSIDFVYVDAAHNYKSVAADIDLWIPKVKIGGYIGGHDYGNDDQPDGGVKKAVDERFNRFEIFNPKWASWLHKVEGN